jgi:prevent-host-death family protein
MTHKISKSKLKAKMLEVFRNIEATGEELIVTVHGKPVLRIVTIKKEEGSYRSFCQFSRAGCLSRGY